MDLSVIDQLNGNLVIGLERQAMALRQQRVFHSTCCGANPRLRVLAFVAAADIGSNTPLEFLLEGSDIALTMAYTLPGRALPRDLPDHDLAFVAIAATPSNRRLLAELEERLACWPAPVVNLPERVSMLEPDDLAFHLHGVRRPAHAGVRAHATHELAAGLGPRGEALTFPIIVKPGTDAVWEAEKIDAQDALDSLFARRRDIVFRVAPFIDCRGADGLYRKIRVSSSIAEPYACHLAVSDGWNASHIDARMEADALRRFEEERFFTTFDTDFAARHASTFAALVERVGLTYFGVDCAETACGRSRRLQGRSHAAGPRHGPGRRVPLQAAADAQAVRRLLGLSLSGRRTAARGRTAQMVGSSEACSLGSAADQRFSHICGAFTPSAGEIPRRLASCRLQKGH